MVAIESRPFRDSPFYATVRSVESTGEAPPLPVVVETASPSGGVVRIPPNGFQTGDRLVLSVQAAQHKLLDVVAEVVRMEPSNGGGSRAGVEFHPQLPKRQFVLMRRVADRRVC
jgi:hypothetical protein